MRKLLERRADQGAAGAVDLADLVLAELRAGQQAMLEDRGGHALPDTADAIARIWRIGFRTGLGGHGCEGSIGDVRLGMLVEELYPITDETLYNLRTFCVHMTANAASVQNAPDSL